MAIRSYIDENPRVTAIAASILLVIVLISIYSELRGPSATKIPTKAYFSVDDGQSWFADDLTKIPPFDHDGRQAVKCFVYSTSTSKRAVYLEKIPDSSRRSLAQPASPVSDNAGVSANAAMALTAHGETLVKKPGDKNWVNEISPEGQQVINPGPDAVSIEP